MSSTRGWGVLSGVVGISGSRQGRTMLVLEGGRGLGYPGTFIVDTGRIGCLELA